jgi:hypothetical protein
MHNFGVDVQFFQGEPPGGIISRYGWSELAPKRDVSPWANHSLSARRFDISLKKGTFPRICRIIIGRSREASDIFRLRGKTRFQPTIHRGACGEQMPQAVAPQFRHRLKGLIDEPA